MKCNYLSLSRSCLKCIAIILSENLNNVIVITFLLYNAAVLQMQRFDKNPLEERPKESKRVQSKTDIFRTPQYLPIPWWYDKVPRVPLFRSVQIGQRKFFCSSVEFFPRCNADIIYLSLWQIILSQPCGTPEPPPATSLLFS